MEAFYDATILLSIGLTAVLGAVFAVSTTFLGRSLQRAQQDAEKTEREAKEEADKTISEIKGTLETASSDVVDRLRKQLAEAEKREKKRRLKRWFSQRFTGPHLLGVNRGVIFPGAFFVAAAVGSAYAKAGVDDPTISSAWWWSGALLALTFGISTLLLTLKEVERVSRPGQEVSFRDQTEAFKQALVEREEETRPICLVTLEEDLPLQITPEEKREITFRVGMTQGSALHNVTLSIFMSPGFLIVHPKGEPVPAVKGASYPGWTRAQLWDGYLITSGVVYSRSATVQAPHEVGTYKIGYAVTSEEYKFNTFHDSSREFAVEVVPGDSQMPQS